MALRLDIATISYLLGQQLRRLPTERQLFINDIIRKPIKDDNSNLHGKTKR